MDQYLVEVQYPGDEDWRQTPVSFSTFAEAQAHGDDLALNTQVTRFRVVELER